MKYEVVSYPAYSRKFKTLQAAERYAAKLKKKLIPCQIDLNGWNINKQVINDGISQDDDAEIAGC